MDRLCLFLAFIFVLVVSGLTQIVGEEDVPKEVSGTEYLKIIKVWLKDHKPVYDHYKNIKKESDLTVGYCKKIEVDHKRYMKSEKAFFDSIVSEIDRKIIAKEYKKLASEVGDIEDKMADEVDRIYKMDSKKKLKFVYEQYAHLCDTSSSEEPETKEQGGEVKKYNFLEVDKNKKITYIYQEKKSKTLVLVMPGASQSKGQLDGLKPVSDAFAERGFSTARVCTNFGPIINHIKLKITNLKYLKMLMDKMKKDHKIDNFIICGFSNGGTGGLQAAEIYSKDIKAVLAVPGGYRSVRKINGTPIFLRIGEKDALGWKNSYQLIKNSLIKNGAKVDAKIVKGAQHIFKLNWNEIDMWLNKNKLMAVKK